MKETYDMAEKRIKQGLHPLPDYELQMSDFIEATKKQRRIDSTMTMAMIFLFGVLIALVVVIVLLEVAAIG